MVNSTISVLVPSKKRLFIQSHCSPNPSFPFQTSWSTGQGPAGQGKATKVRKGVCQTKGWHTLTTLPSGCFCCVSVWLRYHLKFFVDIDVKRELIPSVLQCLVFYQKQPLNQGKDLYWRVICIFIVIYVTLIFQVKDTCQFIESSLLWFQTFGSHIFSDSFRNL